jgi:hypothetical protein
MHSQGLDGVVGKVHTLITTQGEWAAELRKNKLVHESCHDHCNVCLQCFGLHPLGSVISCQQNIVISCIRTCWFNWAYEINTPFVNGLAWSIVISLAKLVWTKLPIH